MVNGFFGISLCFFLFLISNKDVFLSLIIEKDAILIISLNQIVFAKRFLSGAILAAVSHATICFCWAEVLEASDKSLAYNSANSAFFAVRDLRPVDDLTLEQMLKEKGISQPPNIIVS